MASTAARVAADSQFFDSMLTLIPVSYYYPTQEDQGSKFMHNKAAKAGAGAAHKGRKRGATEEADGSTVKKTRTVEEKQSQFDPANYKTVLDVQKANFPAEAPKAKSKPKKPAKIPVVAKESKPKEEENTKPQAASSMDDLRKRLHDKINMLRSGRKPEPTKQQQEYKKQAKKQKPKSKPLAPKKPKREEKTGNTDKPKPAATDKPNLDFKFASLKSSDEKAETFKGRRRDTNAKALQKLEHYNQYMSKLEAEDPEKAKALKHQKQYQASILRAQGVTVKDDAKMLKNAIRKAEKRTKKSQKEWKERSKDVKQALKNKQIKRNENLAARAKGKKKKGRPGFEGSGTFLN